MVFLPMVWYTISRLVHFGFDLWRRMVDEIPFSRWNSKKMEYVRTCLLYTSSLKKTISYFLWMEQEVVISCGHLILWILSLIHIFGVSKDNIVEDVLNEWESKYGLHTKHINVSTTTEIMDKLSKHEIDCFVSVEESRWEESRCV